MSIQPVVFHEMGTMSYRAAWDYQEELLAANVLVKTQKYDTGRKGDQSLAYPAETVHHLLFVEHPPVYTLGKSGKIEHVLISEEERERQRIDFYKINRGGDITFHGPGQLVAYPIFDLEKFYTDIGRYLRDLEEVVIRTLADYQLMGSRSKGETGVWLDPDIAGRERKICAMGIRCSRWITMHGLAFNINNDLHYFDNIVPCGIRDKQVTSLKKELGRELDIDEVKARMKMHFQEIFGIDFVEG